MRSLFRLFALSLALLPAFARPCLAAEKPALVVLISVDQFRRDYLDRFAPFFVSDGFHRLLTEGADYGNCHFRHAFTITAPGHATLSSGVHPDVHGIIANDWRQGPTLSMVNAVQDNQATLIGPADTASHPGRSPRNMLAPTASDQLKLATQGKARVVSISLKDRAAILMGGQKADAAYWLIAGNFISSNYYMKELPQWVNTFNGEQHALSWQGKQWDHLLATTEYDRVQGPDNGPGEEDVLGLGITLPKQLGAANGNIPDKRFLELFPLTPFASDMMLEFAKQAVQAEALGKHEVTDMLCLGFSQIDIMGHTYGPDSHEMMDSVIRLDRVIASLLHYLDETVGKGRYTVVLTADHGCTPTPERLRQKGVEASRFDRPGADAAVAKALLDRFGPAPSGKAYTLRDAFGYRILNSAFEEKHIDRNEALLVVKQALLAWPQIAAAFTREELLTIPAEPAGDSLIERVRRSYFPDRSADIVYVMKPNVTDKAGSGCSHGSPYECDDHVPQVWFGAGVTAGHHDERIGQDNLAPTLCHLVGAPPPPAAKAAPLF